MPSIPLSAVPVGAFIHLAGRVIVNDASGLELTILTVDRQPHGQLVVAPDLSFSGGFTDPMTDIPVSLAGRPFSVGDVVMSAATKETMVVRETWMDPDGFHWSNSPGRTPAYPTEGWGRVGTATII